MLPQCSPVVPPMFPVALPGLRGLDSLTQPTAYDHRTDPRRKGLSPEARRRAKAIGARVAD